MPHTDLLRRIRSEFLEMPGLRLTVPQAQRLCGVERGACQTVLDALVESKFLCVKSDGAYARASEGEWPRPRPAPAAGRGRPAASRAS